MTQPTRTYKVGYFVGSLSSTSINRILSRSLIRLAPRELTFTEQAPEEFRAEMERYGVGSKVVTMMLAHWAGTVDEPPFTYRDLEADHLTNRLRSAGGAETDLTFLGPVSSAAAAPEHAFDLQIGAWLASGLGGGGDWLVPDDEAPDGVAVDVSAWSAAARPVG